MLAMETWQHVNETLLIVLGFGSLLLFRKPLGRLLVQLESLQSPFLSARFTKHRQHEADDDEKDAPEPPVDVGASEWGPGELGE